jgi:anti-sigma regulatory factor (Ser/Thr protein kinase)
MAKEVRHDAAAPVLDVRHGGDVITAGRAARDYASDVGFAGVECDQIALAVSELASNLVRHAGGGTLRMSTVTAADRTGIVIETEDQGPGIVRADRALADGFSTAGGLGTGLGTVHRIMDELDFSARPSGGLKVMCCRWIRPSTKEMFIRPLIFGVATRARRNDTQNGDAFVVRIWARGALAGVVDGLGHGEHAERAAQAARAYLEDHFDQPVSRLFAGVAQACRRTRGVVMALARFDFDSQAVEIGSVGNVDVRLYGGTGRPNFMVRRGILGVNAPNPVVTSHEWTVDSILVLHSDGLHTHWDASALPRATWAAPDEAARELLEAHGKDDDDATVVVVRSARR